MASPRTRAGAAFLLMAFAVGLAGCAGPLSDETNAPDAGYPSQTERPPPAAPNEPVFPTPIPTPVDPRSSLAG